MAKRGRPVGSQIRQNIIEIIYYLEKGYGYQIFKIYREIFPSVSQRNIYYHLKKGVQTGEIEVHKVETEKGDFSWGNSVEKVYYTLGARAEPKGEERVKQKIKQGLSVVRKDKKAEDKKAEKERAGEEVEKKEGKLKRGLSTLVSRFKKKENK
jgi:hypothetical protein